MQFKTRKFSLKISFPVKDFVINLQNRAEIWDKYKWATKGSLSENWYRWRKN